MPPEAEIDDAGFRVVRVRDPFTPTEKQRTFFQACADPNIEEILFDGSIRGGKTQACCKQIVAWAWKHGGKYAVARKTYRELEDSTKAVMLRGEGGLPPALPQELYEPTAYRAGDNMVTLKNGAEILFRNMENAEEGRAKFRNISLNALFIDQVEELHEPEFAELYEEMLGRLSDPRGPRKAILAANPGPSDHWVHRRFIDRDSAMPWCARIMVKLSDNRDNLDEKYFLSRMRTADTNPDYFKRMIMGEWGVFSGARFKCWSEKRHVIDPFEIPKHWEVIEGIDYGSASPFACLWVAISPLEQWFVVAEHYAKELPLSTHVKEIQHIRRELNLSPTTTWLDPSCWRSERNEWESIALELTDLGVYPAKAQNERLGGWARLEEFLATEIEDEQGMKAPRLRFFNRCRNVIRELPNARYRENSDDIEKLNDHALDALRYTVMSRPYVPVDPDDGSDDDMREAYAQRIIDAARAREREPLYFGG